MHAKFIIEISLKLHEKYKRSIVSCNRDSGGSLKNETQVNGSFLFTIQLALSQICLILKLKNIL